MAAVTRRAPVPAPEAHQWHWEGWLLRAFLLALLVFQVVQRNRSGVTVAAEGLVVSFVPQLIEHFSHVHAPRLIERVNLLTIALQFTAESTKLFELFYYWDKLVHPTEVFLATFILSYLLLGYLDTPDFTLPRPLAAAIAMLFGASLGTFWEFLEFFTDWFANADLQKSNADTMTDIFANDAGAVFAALLAFWLYHHHATEHQRRELGDLAKWLGGGLGELLDRHGRLIGVLFALFVLGLGVGAWLVDRNPTPLPPGLAQGQPQQWTFAIGAAGAAAPPGGD